MAFGLGFNKAKVLSTAEKFVSQGKIAAAIEEYRKILQHDSKDLVILNTVADLYARTGNDQEAVKRFFELADKCREAGLMLRAIAVYKRITKMVPDSLEALLKLGELYSSQGLLRDARNHYLQVVEICIRRHEMETARDIFERILMLDTENPQLQVRMAELYSGTGKKEEAISTYMRAVERFLDKNQPAEAGAVLQAIFKLDPQNTEARVLLGRTRMEQGDFSKAVETLSEIPSFATRKDVLKLLFHAHTKLGDRVKAKEIATELFEAHEDFAGLAQISEESVTRGELNEALEIYDSAFQRLLAQRGSSRLFEGLQKILASQPTHLGALELMLNARHAAGMEQEARETTERLANACVAQDQLERARELFSELVSSEPENPDHRHMLRQVEQRMGIGVPASDASLEPVVAMVSDLSAPPGPEPPRTETLPPLEDRLLKNCLTEAELYITYHQAARAIEVLENGLLKLPGNITINEQLLSLCEQSRDYSRAAKCCEVLTEAYIKLGDGERASRFGELFLSYQQKAQESNPEPAEAGPAEQPALPGREAATLYGLAAESPPVDQPQVREVDLSMEWATVSSAPEVLATEDLEAHAVEELESYIQAGLISEATETLKRLRERSPSHPAIPQFQEKLGQVQAAAAFAPEATTSEPTLVEEYLIPSDAGQALPASISESGLASDVASPEQAQDLLLEEVLAPVESPASAPTFELSLEEAEVEAQHALSPPFSSAEMSAPAAELNLAATLESSPEHLSALGTAGWPEDAVPAGAGELGGMLILPAQPVKDQETSSSRSIDAATEPTAPAAGLAIQEQGGLLEDIFAEFKAELEEPDTTEDLETHYNMGVAFKEMALYDEAIGEFQNVHQLALRNNDYSHVVQCCSLLAFCFLAKGLPQLAVKWYQTALDSPGLDPESGLALLYEMATAYESAGDREAALRSFLEVYARNIDYRDVAERIRCIQQAG